jgi:hypothetical protein
MLLRVDPKTAIWGFGEDLWFTVADPKPQDVDIEGLPEAVRDAVLGALRTGALFEVDLNGDKVETAPLKPQEASPTPAATEREFSIKPVGLDIRPKVEEQIKKVLSGGVTSIRREVSRIKSSLFLTAAIILEKQGKNRKTVISLLEKQLLAIPSGTYMGYDVTEEEGETVTIERQRLDVTEEVISDEEAETVVDELEKQVEGD